MKKNIIVVLLFLFLGGCRTKKSDVALADTSWYLYKSSDTDLKILNTDTIYATLNRVSRNICVYHFSNDSLVKNKLLVPNVSFGLVNYGDDYKKWKLEKDTLTWGEDLFLIKTITKDSLLLQKIDSGSLSGIINTYYRIGI